MNSKDRLHEKAEKYRKDAAKACNDYNAIEKLQVIDEFMQSEEGKIFSENADYVTGLIVERLQSVQKGQATYPLRPYDAETLVRLLTVSTTVDYDIKVYDNKLSDEQTIEDYENNCLLQTGFTDSASTGATVQQRDIRKALCEYATAAAAYAKHIGSASLLEWTEMADILTDRLAANYPELTEMKALRVIELERSAANRLRLDKFIFELPPFAPQQKKAKG